MFSTSVKVNVQLDHHDLPLEMQAILVNDGMLMSHLKYLIKSKMEGREDGWMTKSIQAVRYLIDYTIINKENFSNPHDLFMAFSHRINSGTISRNGSDPSMLRWWPRSTTSANEMIYHVVKYSDWLCDQVDDISLLVNPLRKATKSETLVNLAAYNQRMNRSFLKHTYSEEHEEAAVKYVRALKQKKAISTFDDPEKPFDEDKIWDLLGNGFKRRGVSPNAPTEEKYNLGNILITMLMHFGGLRVCEPFHLYVDDIIPNEGMEQIRVYHPSEGLAPRWYRNATKQPNCNRSLYLQQKYGRTHRRDARKGSAYYAGWKDPQVAKKGKYFPVFIFGEPGIRELFYKLFTLYIHTRTKPLPGREHPFLFTNGNGDPLSMGDFQEAHENAVIKLGMSPYLEDGGSCHSHRHSYAHRLAELKKLGIGIDELIIKGALHHASVESQKVYTNPHTKEIEQQLSKASELTTKFMPEGILVNF